jgi:hypothetical protein
MNIRRHIPAAAILVLALIAASTPANAQTPPTCKALLGTCIYTVPWTTSPPSTESNATPPTEATRR